jgi:hypothetical protein
MTHGGALAGVAHLLKADFGRAIISRAMIEPASPAPTTKTRSFSPLA